MRQVTCLICRREFETTHGTQRHCSGCLNFVASGMAAVYGLHKDGDREIRYIGSTSEPVSRFGGHRNGRANNNGKLDSWIRRIGKGNLRMVILEVVPVADARASEETQIRHYGRAGHRLFNRRQAIKRIYSESEAHNILSRWLDGRKADF